MAYGRDYQYYQGHDGHIPFSNGHHVPTDLFQPDQSQSILLHGWKDIEALPAHRTFLFFR
jgi:hypothetical protein